jgi:SAM-dependent methyltransferase
MSSSFNALNSDAYDQFMGRWSEKLAVPFIEMAKIDGHHRILDVGCGTGSLIRTVLDRTSAKSITGIDYSEIYCDAARRRFSDQDIVIDVGDACALPYANGSFDRTLALLVLHFVPRATDAISEMRRVTRPGGRIGAAVWDSYGGMPNQRMFWDTAAALDSRAEAARTSGYWRPMVRPGELRRAFVAVELENVCDCELHIRMDYADFEDFWSPIGSGEGALGKYTLSLDGPGREILVRAVKAAYMAGEPDGPRSFTATAWACAGDVPA